MANPSDVSDFVREVYREAMKRDPEEWSEFLDRACAGRPADRERVEILLGVREAMPAGQTTVPPPATATPTLVEGSSIGHYIVRRELGHGGMGTVYLADDTRLSRRVALKAISITLSSELAASLRDRLINEAKVVAALSHPSIATVYALEEIEGRLYLACEYVPGEPLRALLKSGPMPIAQVVDIALQLARALATAHTQGVVHRDIKPENVMRTPSGVIKVLDFGLAKADSAVSAHLTMTGAIVGTPAYLSPEQARGMGADYRSDIFALGVVAYELASGRNPFAASELPAILGRIVNEEPPPLSHVRPQSPPLLDAILAKCLEKDPRERYQSTLDVVADLERLQLVLQEQKSSSNGWRSARPSAPRPRWWWEMHQLCVALVYVGMLYPAWYVQRFLPSQWGTLLLLAVLGTVAAGVSMRLHLLFVARHFHAEAKAQERATRPRLRACDVAFGALLLVTALVIGPDHPEFSMLFVGVAAATLVASFVIEPATARVAFGGDSETP